MSTMQEKLIERAVSGDIAAFEELIAAEQTRIYNIALRLCGNEHDAYDLAQETLLRVYTALGSFRGTAKLSTWIYQIELNLFRDMRRKQHSSEALSLDETWQQDDEAKISVADARPGPEELYENREWQQALRDMVDELPPPFKEVIVLREYLSYSYEEIAAALDISVGTVKSRLNRGRSTLCQKIMRYQEQNKDFSGLTHRPNEK